MSKPGKIIILLSITMITLGCLGGRRLDVQAIPTARNIEATQTESIVRATITPPATPTPAPAATDILPTLMPSAAITAATGNIYIRRGPGLEYNPIGVLHKGTSAMIIGRDVLSDWVQINIPDSDKTGWVTIQTMFSSIEGDLEQVPDFTFTEWPEPAYIKNCTEHDMYVMPGDIVLYSLYTNSTYRNEVQVNPGSYTAYDLFVVGEPEAQTVEAREGVNAYITKNGLGVNHKCP